MKKKTYISPVCEVIKIETQQMLATSVQGLDLFGGYKGVGNENDEGD